MIPSPRRALRRGTAVFLALGLLPVTACTGDQDDPAQASGQPDQVTYLTSFETFGRDAYPYVADAKGFFADENIEVDILPGFGAENQTQISEGQAQFAAIDLTAVAIRRGQGEGDGITAVAAIHQQTPAALMAVDPDISSPQDLPGRSVFMADGSILDLLFPAYAELAGLNPDDVTIQRERPATLIPALAAGDADAIEQFTMGLPTVRAGVEGRDVTVLPYSDVLRDLFGVAIFTSTGMVEDDPDLVQRFVRALLRGLDDAIANPEEAGQILATAVPETNPEVAAQELEEMAAYVVPLEAGAPVGSIDEKRISRSLGSLESAGLIPADTVAPGDLVAFELTPGSESTN